jgi:hypothetical protein
MLTAKKKQLVTDYGVWFKSEHGKRVLADLCAHFDLPMIRSNPTLSTNTVLYQGGQRSVIDYVIKMIETNPNIERARHAINEPQNQ